MLNILPTEIEDEDEAEYVLEVGHGGGPDVLDACSAESNCVTIEMVLPVLGTV